MTVNRALRELTDEGHIIRRAGMGSFVAGRRMRGQAADIESIRDELASRGEVWSATVLSQNSVKASEAFAGEFGADSGTELFHLLIVHKGDGQPIELEERWVNPDIAPALLLEDFTKTTPTDYLLSVAPLLRPNMWCGLLHLLHGKLNFLKLKRVLRALKLTAGHGQESV